MEGESQFRPIWPALPHEIRQRRRHIQHRHRLKCIVVVAKQKAELGVADTGCILKHGLEYPTGIIALTSRDGTLPYCAASLSTLPSRRRTMASFALHMRAAVSATASSTGCRSVGELAITCNSSLVAVCCSSASERCPRASASSRVRSPSCFFSSTTELASPLMGVVAL